MSGHYAIRAEIFFKCLDGTPPPCRAETASPSHPVRALVTRPPSTATAPWVLLLPEAGFRGLYMVPDV